jgi:replication-associated recombination protein RarA
MYADHFGLNDDPFRIAPSLRYVHRGRNFEASLRTLRAGLLGRRRTLLLESAPGLGKTALLKLLAEELRRRGVEAAFEACRSWTTAEALLRSGGSAVLLLDEAHNLAERELAELLRRAPDMDVKLVFADPPEFAARFALSLINISDPTRH